MFTIPTTTPVLHKDRPDCGLTSCYWHGDTRRKAAEAQRRWEVARLTRLACSVPAADAYFIWTEIDRLTKEANA